MWCHALGLELSALGGASGVGVGVGGSVGSIPQTDDRGEMTIGCTFFDD